MGKIYAPWDKQQVKGLNAWQQCDWVHPFTCSNRNDDAHHKYAEEHHEGDHGILIATEKGWVCPVCDYTQNWAHDCMAQGAPLHPFKI
jgi:hypothetical protein